MFAYLLSSVQSMPDVQTQSHTDIDALVSSKAVHKLNK